MNKLKKSGFVFVFICFNFLCFSQTANPQTAEPIDFMRSEGKLYVVMAVVVTILLGIFFYLVNLDRKIKNLEKDN